MECGVEYRSFGPEHLNVVGETEFVRDLAKASAGQNKAAIAGIIGHADLEQDQALLREALQAHEEAGAGLFRGIRHGGAHDSEKNLGWLNATPTPIFSPDRVFAKVSGCLASWIYFPSKGRDIRFKRKVQFP